MLTTFVEGGWPFNRYSREVLLLSFSPPSYASRLMGISMLQNKQIKMLMRKMRDASTSQFDLNRKTWMSSRNGEKCITSTRQQHIGAAETRTWPRELKARQTGFKPYTRCFVEANENVVANASSRWEEKGPESL